MFLTGQCCRYREAHQAMYISKHACTSMKVELLGHIQTELHSGVGGEHHLLAEDPKLCAGLVCSGRYGNLRTCDFACDRRPSQSDLRFSTPSQAGLAVFSPAPLQALQPSCAQRVAYSYNHAKNHEVETHSHGLLGVLVACATLSVADV